MRILVIGATGAIGKQLVPQLLEDDHQVIAMIRDPDKGQALTELGAELCIADLEGAIEHAFVNIDLVVFTAGSGSHTGKDKTLMVDLWGAVRCIHAAEMQTKPPQFIMVSALKAKDPERGSAALKPYLVAKHAADEYLRHSQLNYSIVRPGRLHDPETIPPYTVSPPSDAYEGFTSRINVARYIAQLIRQFPDCTRQTVDLLDTQ
ncbi:SDR family oxidoreductase [Coraliomargarita akajimensis]|uniref:NmrA family protein n=1 Tax=Coraliomargarita akajimensis (strain DSM 45221 / IAM 15411 / JCM 23193 / KCTC 12865 / 04OKA010-24) TaxID=583355 RepID=D5ELM8_CORAD|nr:SDR family oxidoreductase [Coraliomargarita akajimensis]ADE53203.1 NmrA family protein [Coraliomargarita akajimensis DSM 45221]